MLVRNKSIWTFIHFFSFYNYIWDDRILGIAFQPKQERYTRDRKNNIYQL